MNSEQRPPRTSEISPVATAAVSTPLRGRARDAAIRDLAARQHGVVTRGQLCAAGIPGHAADHRLRDGRLVPLYRGVYRVAGPIRGRYESEMAAALAGGERAVVSHHSALGLWGLGPERSRGQIIDLSVLGGHRRLGRGVRVHRLRRLEPQDRGVVHGIAVTAPARTILDVAAGATTREVEQAMAFAERVGLVGEGDLREVVDRYPRARGSGLLRALLTRSAAPAFARSELEERLLRLVRRARLPRPRTNARVEGYEVDFLWPAARLVVEADGEAYHADRVARERDRRRDADLVAAGHRVMRISWRQLEAEPEATVARLARALAVAGR